MATHRTDLALVQLIMVSEPCPLAGEGWGKLQRARFCEQCGLDVHNLSAMSTVEAASLVRNSPGRLCVRYSTDRRGRAITGDRPMALLGSRMRGRLGSILRPLAALVGLSGLLAWIPGCNQEHAMGGSVRFQRDDPSLDKNRTDLPHTLDGEHQNAVEPASEKD